MSYQAWMREVDGVLLDRIGMRHTDIADQTWRDWYESDMSPDEAAEEALDNEGFPLDDE